MLTAREIMTPDATCIGERDSLTEAAQKYANLGLVHCQSVAKITV